MNANGDGEGERRGDHLRQRSAELHRHASALLAIARRIIHDVRNTRLEAQLLLRVRKS